MDAELKDALGLIVSKLGAIDTKVDDLTARVCRIETRLDGIETRLDGIETRLDGIETRLDAQGVQLSDLSLRMDRQESATISLLASQEEIKHAIAANHFKLTGRIDQVASMLADHMADTTYHAPKRA